MTWRAEEGQARWVCIQREETFSDEQSSAKQTQMSAVIFTTCRASRSRSGGSCRQVRDNIGNGGGWGDRRRNWTSSTRGPATMGRCRVFLRPTRPAAAHTTVGVVKAVNHLGFGLAIAWRSAFPDTTNILGLGAVAVNVASFSAVEALTDSVLDSYEEQEF